MAGEMPNTISGGLGKAWPPGLPAEVVDDLARRARDAEKNARKRLLATEQRFPPVPCARSGTRPTFTRYTFPFRC